MVKSKSAISLAAKRSAAKYKRGMDPRSNRGWLLTQKRKFNREWTRKRRESFFKDKECAHCGTLKKLTLDHINPKDKVDHKIWSWRESRRIEELRKCQVLCVSCHKAKTKKDYRSGKMPPRTDRRLSNKQVRYILISLKKGTSQRKLALQFGINRKTIYHILVGSFYANVRR